ncbi:hypothetical protein SAICODRAFT_24994 [Saitoella complicata NRRL Y-17804]|uniref:DnaJ homologue subfamily C member 28 conserved domain-containing protein n=1 Tax=Saitoella complicata (strain BCRC 22490 / CBS 7301 / JCM 7358 / NBRC 10748 / NRRL Y-17804) TaxID=698492 RepID=A0A0E9NG95_SAICN|nr:uncharacterized protein SAICODRAFT_24994 [Saitoella complicata NRRL Y-17804]ODQ53310.1 hypothetical protein SAICODRAFT_24994 [Saitoella complicata NRRL Y-17804]GAO48848.1 hypothetical protein G7K_3014-t1 [Saitoella complicata NRRL Y-17804]
MKRTCLSRIAHATAVGPALRRPYALRPRTFATTQLRPKEKDEEEPSALQRRFEALAETAAPTKLDPMAGPAAYQPVDSPDSSKPADELESGLTKEDLARLEQLVLDASFKNEHAGAFAQVTIPSSADKLTRQIAADRPWTGEESQADAVLRMLTDSHKPLRMRGVAPKIQDPTFVGGRVGSEPLQPPTGMSKRKTGHRLLAAKEGVLEYTLDKETGTDARKKKRGPGHSSLAEKLSPGFEGGAAASIGGLRTLADSRIEAAIARGEFAKLPGRGKPAVHDNLASSPFIDNTEYFLNRIIQRQGALPPWIEAQVELEERIEQFRAGLRDEWQRRVVRQIAFHGKSVDEQVARAEAYAESERLLEDIEHKIDQGAIDPRADKVYRDPEWLKQEHRYHTLSLQEINSKTRSYNAQAPYSARRGYLALEKELLACYRDVAPTIGPELRERAKHGWVSAEERQERKVKETLGEGGLKDLFGGEIIHVEKNDVYGLREWWGDMKKSWFSKKTEQSS